MITAAMLPARTPRLVFPLAALLALGACGQTASPGAGDAAPPATAHSERCERARAAIAGSGALVDAGRLQRAERVLERAAELCPEAAPLGWERLAGIYAELGRVERAKELTAQIDGSPLATAEARAAAKAAQEKAAALSGRSDYTDAAKAPIRAKAAEAAAQLREAERASDPEGLRRAKASFLAVWEAFHPNGEALLGAARAAGGLGEAAAAQRLVNRALADLEQEAGAPVTLEAPNGFDGGVRKIVWSRDGGRLAVAHGSSVSFLDRRGSAIEISRRMGAPDDELMDVAISPDGQSVAAVASTGAVYLWQGAWAARRMDRPSGGAPPAEWAAIAFSPDGALLASTAPDNAVVLWDAASGELRRTLTGHRTQVDQLSFAADGKTLLSQAYAEVRFWDVATGGPPVGYVDDHPNPLALSPDGHSFASTPMRDRLELWDMITRKTRFDLITVESHTEHFNGSGFSADGKTLLATQADGTVHLFNTATGRRRHPALVIPGVASVRLTRDAKTLAAAVGNDDRQPAYEIGLWDAANGRKRQALGRLEGSAAIELSPDDTALAASSNDAVTIWEMATGRPLVDVRRHAAPVVALALSPDGKRLAGGSSDGRVSVWGLADGSLRTMRSSGGWVERLLFDSAGKVLASAHRDKKARVHDVETGELRAEVATSTNLAPIIAISPDGAILATTIVTSKGDAIALWDAATGEPRDPLIRHSASDLAFTPDGQALVLGGFGGAGIWSVAEGRRLRTIDQDAGSVAGLVVSSDGRALVTVGYEGMNVWELASAASAPKTHIGADADKDARGAQWAAISADGKTLINRSFQGTASVWDVESGALRHTLAKGTLAAALSPDGRFAATLTTQDRAITLWDARSGSSHARLRGHTRSPTAVTFTRDGERVISASADGSIRIWSTADGKPLVALRTMIEPPGAGYALSLDPSAPGVAYVGAGGDVARCRVGVQALPFELCRDRFGQPSVLQLITGEASELL